MGWCRGVIVDQGRAEMCRLAMAAFGGGKQRRPAPVGQQAGQRGRQDDQRKGQLQHRQAQKSGQRQQPQQAVFQGPLAYAPGRLQHDGNNGRLDAIKQPASSGSWPKAR
jgi:hypothetical protein